MKTKGPDGLSAKFVKMSVKIIDCHSKHSENAKTANLRPIFKKGDRIEIKNYRPVSLLNIF